MATNLGVSTFTAIAVVCFVCQYLILRYIKKRSIEILAKSHYLKAIHLLMTIVQYFLIVVFTLLVMQIIISSFYTTILVNIILIGGWGLGSILMGLLCAKFFLWYLTNKKFIILAYSLASAATSISIIVSVLFFGTLLLEMPSERNALSEVKYKDIEPNSVSKLLNDGYTISNVTVFVLFWTSTALMLHHHSRKLGEVKYWFIMSLPFVSFISIFLVSDQLVEKATTLGLDLVYVYILGYAVPNLSTGILLFMPFWIVAKNLNKGSAIRDYMVIAAFGFLLSNIASTVAIHDAPYPPVGLASISTIGLSYYLIFVGIYYSVISLTEDTNLRREVKKSTIEETKLLGDIASAQIDEVITSRVLNTTKKYRESITEQTGIQTSLSDDDVKNYLEEVMHEITRSKKINDDSYKDPKA